MGLANRVVPKGQARVEAERLAGDISRFPQVCLRNDRRSVYEQYGRDLHQALSQEFALGLAALESGEAGAGAERFVSGQGRSGTFE